jgi:hypothetical protein
MALDQDALRALIAAGGTITHHHAVGATMPYRAQRLAVRQSLRRREERALGSGGPEPRRVGLGRSEAVWQDFGG